MRMMAATICLLVLTGCASNLPYSIAIGDPLGALSAMEEPTSAKETTKSGDQEQCVLQLHKLVDKKAGEYTKGAWTVRNLQVEFEKALHEETQGKESVIPEEKLSSWERIKMKLHLGHPPVERSGGLVSCTDKSGSPIQQQDTFPPLEKVSKKWLTTYALDATDPDQDLNRFREYLLSAQFVQKLAERTIEPDEDENDTSWTEKPTMHQSQWCGSAITRCREQRSLYHVQTYPGNLYGSLLAGAVQVEREGSPRHHRYFVLGYEIPWDKERTLVRYGVTFYFKQDSLKSNTSASDSARPELIGYDLTYANEATPKQPEEKPVANRVPNQQEAKKWWKEAYHITGWPFFLSIGIKNAAFEITKMPFSLMAGVLFGRDQWNYPLENINTAGNALYVEVANQPSWGALMGFYRLILELPLVGQAFQYNPGIDHAEQDVETPKPSSKIFLSRGIYGGNKWGQDTGLWALFARASYPDYDVYSPPYRHGTVIDVVWSMFNLSHGPAYSEARYIMDHASPENRLYLAGHSGGVQRSAAASRILAMHGYRVDKVIGIAGPSVGQAFVDTRYPDAFKVYLNRESGANQDVVSKVGVVAGTYSAALNYALIVPVKYLAGTPLFWVDSIDDTFLFSRRQIYRFFDRVGFSNATIVEVERKPSSRHQTPLRLSFTDRLVFDAYVRNEFATAFKDDLERAGAEGKPKDERPHAFPWEQ